MTDITNQDTIENLDEDISTDEDIVEDTETSQNSKNTSNFKKLNKSYKWAIAKIKELEQKIQETSWAGKDLRLYFLENPEAKEHKEQLLATLEQYPDMDVEDALLLAKQKTPQPSQDKNDFDLTGKTPSKKKDLSELSEEEALQLDNKTYLEWTMLKQWKSWWVWGQYL